MPTTSAMTWISARRWLETKTVLPCEARALSVSRWPRAGRVESVGRLVEQQQLGIAEQRRRDAEPLLQCPSSSLDLVVGAMRTDRRCRAAPRCASKAPDRRTQPAHAGWLGPRVRVESRRFDERPDVEQTASVSTLERLAEHLHRTAVGVDQPGQGPAWSSSCRRRWGPGSRTRHRSGTDRSSHPAPVGTRSSCAVRESPGPGRRCRSWHPWHPWRLLRPRRYAGPPAGIAGRALGWRS